MLDIILCSHYKTPIDRVIACYNSLSNIKYPHEIIVFNTYSQMDGFFQEELRLGKIKFYFSFGNAPAYAKVLNTGIALAKNKYVMHLHCDAEVVGTWVDVAIEKMELDNTIGYVDAVGCRGIIDPGSEVPSNSTNSEIIYGLSNEQFFPIIYGDGFCYVWRGCINPVIPNECSSEFFWGHMAIPFTAMRHGFKAYCLRMGKLGINHFAKNPINFNRRDKERWQKMTNKERKIIKKLYPEFDLI